MSREVTKALKKIKTAGYGSETRIPIHFLMSIFDERNVAHLIARVAVKEDLASTIESSTTDPRVIAARKTYGRLALTLDYIHNQIENLETIYDTELPYETSTVVFRIIK